MWPFKRKPVELEPPPKTFLVPTLHLRWKDDVLQQFWVHQTEDGYVFYPLYFHAKDLTDEYGRWENIPKETST